jgi:hypothetical protein
LRQASHTRPSAIVAENREQATALLPKIELASVMPATYGIKDRV